MKPRKRRLMIPAEQATREAQQARHADAVRQGLCCRAHHFGCIETRPHGHHAEGEIRFSETVEDP